MIGLSLFYVANDKIAKKYERGWYLVSGTSTLVANALLGNARILREKGLDHLKKAHTEAEVLMATAQETCAVLCPEAKLGWLWPSSFLTTQL